MGPAGALVREGEKHEQGVFSQPGGSRTSFRQPMQRIRMVLEAPAVANFDALDAWLESALEIDLEPCICFVPKSGQTAQAVPAIDLAWRCLLVARSLLQAAGVPVFDPGAILEIEQDRRNLSQWVVVAGLAHIDEIPEACYTLAVEAAIKTVQHVPGASDRQHSSDQLFGEIENQALRPLRSMVVAGKSTIPMLRTAYRMEIPFIHIGAGVYQLGWGSKARRLDRSSTEGDALLGAKLAQHKVWSAGLLRMAGLPAPEHGVAVAETDAIHLARKLGWPVVVKPADLDRGEGVATGIQDNATLLAAFKAAWESSKIKQVIVEREVPGVCHRLLVASGRVLYAVKRLPKAVKGNGKQTVAELIRAANQAERIKATWLRLEPFPDDALTVETLRRAGFSLASVPGAGEEVPLRPFETTRWGGGDEDLTASLHPDNRALALRAAALFDLQVAGIDVISPDITKPWHANGAVVNEVNFAPTLGDGPVSKNYLPEFFSDFMNGDGRIPVEVFVGIDRAMTAAKARQQERAQNGIRCFLTSRNLTLDAYGAEILFTFNSLFKRCRALLMNRQVEELVLVVQTDELLHTGLPVDRFTRITPAGNELTSWKNTEQILSQRAIDGLLNLLENFVPSPKSATSSES
jgi:cyanophycin synthetase